MHEPTKAERREAHARVSAYYEAELANLVEHVANWRKRDKERADGRHASN